MKESVANILLLANLVRENIRAKQLFTPSNSILVTLSGGQDSFCSLLLLFLLQNQLGVDLHTRQKPALMSNSSFADLSLNFIREWVSVTGDKQKTKGSPFSALSKQVRETKGGLAKGRVYVASSKTADLKRVLLLFARAQPEAKPRQLQRIADLWIIQPRQLKSVRITRFTAVRDHSFFDISSKNKVACCHKSIICDSKLRSSKAKYTSAYSPEERASKDEHYSSLISSVLLPSFYFLDQSSDQTKKLDIASEIRPLLWPILRFATLLRKVSLRNTSEARVWGLKSLPKKMQISIHSDFYCPTQNQTLFDSAESSFYLNPKGPRTLSPLRGLTLRSKVAELCSGLPNGFRLLSFAEQTEARLVAPRVLGAKRQTFYPQLRKPGFATQSLAAKRLITTDRPLEPPFGFRYAKVLSGAFPVTKTPEQQFISAKRVALRLKNSFRFVGRSVVSYICSGSEFGVLWCNHFWQIESFYTMLHVAKINFCFSSIMCFYLPLESVLSEQNAREWRHKSIQRTSAFYQYDCCTQAHTKSDRVETILFNIVRGTGIPGLQSLQWKKSFYSFSCQRFFPLGSLCEAKCPELRSGYQSVDLCSPLGLNSRREGTGT